MQCPVCKDTNLVMTERQSIEIDYCPSCRGVWLDRGELDKIIERSIPEAPPVQSQTYREPARAPSHDQYRRPEHDNRYYGDKPKHYKRKSLLGELFDF